MDGIHNKELTRNGINLNSAAVTLFFSVWLPRAEIIFNRCISHLSHLKQKKFKADVYYLDLQQSHKLKSRFGVLQPRNPGDDKECASCASCTCRCVWIHAGSSLHSQWTTWITGSPCPTEPNPKLQTDWERRIFSAYLLTVRAQTSFIE